MNIRSLLLLFASIWLVGCPYYNTFYNAKKAFGEAERIRREMQLQQGDRLPDQAIRLYEQAIENSALIVRDHPHSDWVDDALVLIGDSFLAQGQFPQAARKYEEVMTNYPNSKWAPYCMFSKGKASLSAGDSVRAEADLQVFLKVHPRSEWSPEAYLLLGSLSFKQKSHETAIERYTDFLTSYPKHKRRAEAQYFIAEAHLELNRHTEALNLFERVSKIANTNELEFQANYMIGECLRRDQEYEPALQKFSSLMDKGAYQRYRPKIMLALAACQDALSQFDASIAQYEDLMERYDRDQTYGAEVSQAMFELGNIYERQGALPRAEELYIEARQRSPNAFWVRDEADRKSQDINELQKYRGDLDNALAAFLTPDSSSFMAPDSIETAGAADSVRIDEAVDPDRLSVVTEARFQLAEHYLFRFNMVDSALVHYQLIEEETQDQSLAAKAAYARAWIIEHILNDPVASVSGYQTILAKYSHTPYSSEAARALSLPDPNGPSDTDIFRTAETLLFEATDPDSALNLYTTVFEQYPESEHASRALFAMGWITEIYLDDPDSALQIYRQIDTLYPRSDQAQVVSSKIRFIEKLLAESGVSDEANEENSPDESMTTSAESSDLKQPGASEMPGRSAAIVAPPIVENLPLKHHGDVITIDGERVMIKLTASIPVEVGDTGYLYSIDGAQKLKRKLVPFQVLASFEPGKTMPPTKSSQNQLRPGIERTMGWIATLGSNLTVRDGPDGERVGSLADGTLVEILDTQVGWSHIKTRRQEGYVLHRFLKPTDTPDPFMAIEIVGSHAPLAMNSDMAVVFDTKVDVVSRGSASTEKSPQAGQPSVEDTPPVEQISDRPLLTRENMTRNKSQGLVSSLDGNRLGINMLLQKHVQKSDTGYVYIIELVEGVEVAYRIADIQVRDIFTPTLTKGIPVGGSVDFRESPEGRIISMLPPSSSIDILANEGEWQKAAHQGQEGYVLTENISLQTVQEEIVTCQIINTYGTIDTNRWLGIYFSDQ